MTLMDQDFKLPRGKSSTRRSDRNEWLAHDRSQRAKAILATTLIVGVFGAGIWLIVRGGLGLAD